MSGRVAVVTIVRGRSDHLARQRRALAAHPPDLHVVVGMGEPTPADPDPVPTLRLTVPAPGPLPLAAARNAGAAAALDAGADLLVFLDVDCVPGPELLDRYTDAAARVDGAALLCGPVTYLPEPGPDGYPETGLERLAEPHTARPNPPAGALWPEPRRELFWSLSFAVTAATWRASGGFCEHYRGYGAEDTDFALSTGAPLIWVGGAHAFHQHHPPARLDPDRLGELVANARVFHRRRGFWPMSGWLHELHDAGAVEFDPAAGTLRRRA